MAGPVQKYIQGTQAVEIAGSVEEGIRRGDIAAGARLPTVRALAGHLGVSPTTVAAAYKELRSRGLLLTEGRRGTRVSPAPPVASIAAASPALPPGVRDLAAGNPDAALLPRLGPFLAQLDPEPRLYTDAVHHPELLELAGQRLRAERIPAGALSVVSGAMDGIERVLQAWLRPGDRVAVEDPGFTGVLHLVRALGLALLPVEVDDEGPRPEALERALASGAKALVVTPRAQNPTGAALSAARVRELRAVLERAPECLVIEDDHASGVAGAPARSLCTRETPRYAVVRSVSKALGPDLRVALLAGDAGTLARVEGRQVLGLRWVSHLLQELVVRLWSDPGVERQVERAERCYAARAQALIAALEEHGIPSQGRSGLNVWVPVPEETSVVQHLAQAGFAVRAGEVYRIETPPAVRITTAALREEEAPQVARALAEALRGRRAPAA